MISKFQGKCVGATPHQSVSLWVTVSIGTRRSTMVSSFRRVLLTECYHSLTSNSGSGVVPTMCCSQKPGILSYIGDKPVSQVIPLRP